MFFSVTGVVHQVQERDYTGTAYVPVYVMLPVSSQTISYILMHFISLSLTSFHLNIYNDSTFILASFLMYKLGH